jgi:glycerol-3-phosphate dehydrogenase
VPGWSKDSDAVVSRAARHLFVVPWRDCMLIGVWHRLFAGRPDTAQVEEAEIAAWIQEMNASYPALRLVPEDVIYANCGLVPFGDGRSSAGELSFGKESRYTDHRGQGIAGLVTLIGIRYTTARGDSAKALDLLLQQLPRPPQRAPTARTPLAGGDFEDFATLRRTARQEVASRVAPRTLDAWLRNHGTGYRLLSQLAQAPAQALPLGTTDTVMAELTHAVEHEMAVHLQDVILRRTDMGSGAHPGPLAIEQAAAGMQNLMGWSDERRRAEIADTEQSLRRHRAAIPKSAAIVQ